MSNQPATITNYSTLIFLINKNCRAIKAVYEPDAEGKSGTDTKSKKEIFKTFDPTISVGDYLVVPSSTRLELTTVRVTDVDVEVDLESSATVRWIVGQIDMEAYEQVKRSEDQAITRVKSAKANAAREELRKQLLADLDNTEIETLQIAHMGAPAAPQVPGT